MRRPRPLPRPLPPAAPSPPPRRSLRDARPARCRHLYQNNLKGSIPPTLKDLTEVTDLIMCSNPGLGGLLPELNWKQYTNFCSVTLISFACPLPAGSDQCHGNGPAACSGPPVPVPTPTVLFPDRA